ncbi:DNA -binding domain-containing protein [Sphingomonas crusticola]|uniref:DNA -binding domain-containing protein n=1 Tax=Sphingomonas crusticola TaxID=1697973 RepID=UPI000E232247|nr:DUF2285 domain-containing protein [Sphingomonas crusticola]
MASCPDGTRLADYEYLRELDRAGLMWEWLRRDPAYTIWYLRASTATRGTMPAPSRWRLAFAEDPARPAPEAAILWRAELDPGVLGVIASPTGARDPNALPVSLVRRWTTLVMGDDGIERAVLSDRLHHIRLDVAQGTLARGPVVLHYLLEGTRDTKPKLLTLRRLMAICLERQFPASLFPAEPRIERWLALFRVADALRAGASQRELAEMLYGRARVRAEWTGSSDSLRSRIRRLVGEAHHLAGGGYRWLMRRSAR